MAIFLYKQEKRLEVFGINDPNYNSNAKELIKIFIKKTFLNVKTIIESILKSEREIKAIKNEDGILITNGPSDLFKILYTTFDLIKAHNNRALYEQMLYLFKECIMQYLIGVDYVINVNKNDK